MKGSRRPQRERLYANRVALTYYGVSLDEWRQRTHRAEVHPDDADRVQTDIDPSLRSGTAYQLDMRLRGSDGAYRWFLVRYNALQDDQGQIVRWYIAATDIEDRKRDEQKLQQENVALREEIDKTSMFEAVRLRSRQSCPRYPRSPAAIRRCLSPAKPVPARNSSHERFTGGHLVPHEASWP